MKWLLPEPNEPVRNAPRLIPVRQRVGDQAERVVERIGQAGGDDVLVEGPLEPGSADTLSVSRST